MLVHTPLCDIGSVYFTSAVAVILLIVNVSDNKVNVQVTNMGIVVEVLGELENFHMSREELEVGRNFCFTLLL